MFHRSGYLLTAAMLVAPLSGCDLLDAWRQRAVDPPPTQTVDRDEFAPGIYPGHSVSPEVYNDNYDPYGTGPEPTERYAPPPAPPVRPEFPPAQPAPESGGDLAPSTDGQLIRALKTPGLFSPDGVRSIYDRLRGTAGAGEESAKPDGPIAQRLGDPSSTRACQFRSEEQGPVQLGLPEVTGHSAGNQATTHIQRQPANVTQACPSAYRSPMLADPTAAPIESR